MKIKEVKCKNCGASLKIDEQSKKAKCEYCKTEFLLEDAEKDGYEFEKGRLKAQVELFNEITRNVPQFNSVFNKKKKKLDEIDDEEDDQSKIFKYSKNRKWYVNLIFCLISFIGLLVIPSIIYLLLNLVIKNSNVCDILANIIFILILYLMYYKDLNKEFKIFKNNFKSNMKVAFKYYIVGMMGMVFFNLLIVTVLKDISSNESQVRELLFNDTIFALISIMIIAPISEEIIFRKSLQPLIKNKWVYAICCGLLFGGAHILTNILNNAFVLSDLFYILPYASLGVSFALMDYDTKTTVTSICIHAFHNSFTAILLLITYFGGI